MLREFAISIYLLLVYLTFQFSKLFSLQQKTVFVISFPGNLPTIVEQLNKYSLNEEIVVIETNDRSIHIATNEPYRKLALRHPIQFFQSIYQLATSRRIFIDNYYAFLAAMDFKDE